MAVFAEGKENMLNLVDFFQRFFFDADHFRISCPNQHLSLNRKLSHPHQTTTSHTRVHMVCLQAPTLSTTPHTKQKAPTTPHNPHPHPTFTTATILNRHTGPRHINNTLRSYPNNPAVGTIIPTGPNIINILDKDSPLSTHLNQYPLAPRNQTPSGSASVYHQHHI